MSTQKQRSEAAKIIGSLGGKSGSGKAKTRSKAHYRRMTIARAAHYAAKRLAAS